MLLPMLLAGALVLAAEPAVEAGKDLDPSLVLAGVVLEAEGESPISGADVAISFEGRRIASFRSEEAGWFESPPLPRALLGKTINLSVLQRGYKIFEERQVLREYGTFIPILLEPLEEGQQVPSASSRSSRGFLHLYVSHAIDQRPLANAKVTLLVKDEEIATGLTSESGYCTLPYDRRFDQWFASARVTSEGFKDTELESFNLGRSDGMLRALMLPRTELKRVLAFDRRTPVDEILPSPFNTFDALEVYGQNPGYEQVWVTTEKSNLKASLLEDFWRIRLLRSHTSTNALTFHFRGKVKNSPWRDDVLLVSEGVIEQMLKNKVTKEEARASMLTFIRRRTARQLLSFDNSWHTLKDGESVPSWMETRLKKQDIQLWGPTRVKKGELEDEFLIIDGEPGEQVREFAAIVEKKQTHILSYQAALSIQEVEVDRFLSLLLEQLPSLQAIPETERKHVIEKLARSSEELSFEQEVKLERRPYPRRYVSLGLGVGASLGTKPSLAVGWNSGQLILSIFPSGLRSFSALGGLWHIAAGGAPPVHFMDKQHPLGISLVVGISQWGTDQLSEYRNPQDPYVGVGGVWHLGLFLNLHAGVGWTIRPQPRSLVPYVLLSWDII